MKKFWCACLVKRNVLFMFKAFSNQDLCRSGLVTFIRMITRCKIKRTQILLYKTSPFHKFWQICYKFWTPKHASRSKFCWTKSKIQVGKSTPDEIRPYVCHIFASNLGIRTVTNSANFHDYPNFGFWIWQFCATPLPKRCSKIPSIIHP